MTTRIEAENLYQGVRQMIRQEKGIEAGQEIPLSSSSRFSHDLTAALSPAGPGHSGPADVAEVSKSARRNGAGVCVARLDDRDDGSRRQCER